MSGNQGDALDAQLAALPALHPPPSPRPSTLALRAPTTIGSERPRSLLAPGSIAAILAVVARFLSPTPFLRSQA